jgi:hypothetical protein
MWEPKKNVSRIRKKTFYLQFFMRTPEGHQKRIEKWKEGKNSYEGYPTEFAGSTQNPKKIIRTPNLPIRTKIFLRKLFFVP